MSDTPNRGIPLVPEGTLDPAAGLNDALQVIDALLQTEVLAFQSAPPSSPADGDLYIVDPTGTGAWSGLDNYLVRYVAEGTFWQSFAPGDQVAMVLNADDGVLYRYRSDSSGVGWTPVAAAGTLQVDAPDSNATTVSPTARITFTGGLSVQDLGGGHAQVTADAPGALTVSVPDSNATTVSPVTSLEIRGDVRLTSLGGGAARLEILAPHNIFSPVVNFGGTSLTANDGDSGRYTRFTAAGAKTYNFDSTAGYHVGDEYHARNVGSGNLTLAGDSAFTLRPPNGGGLIVKQGGTVTIKITATDEADIMGQTSAT